MSIRTCPTCGTDVDVSNGLLGCPVCGSSLAAAGSGRDEVPTSIRQFFDDVEPDQPAHRDQPHEVDQRRRSDRHRRERLAETAAAGAGAGAAATTDTRELPPVPPAPSAPTTAQVSPDAPRGLLFDDLAGSGPGVPPGDGGRASRRSDPSPAPGRLPGGLLLVGALAVGGLAVLAAFLVKGGSGPEGDASAQRTTAAAGAQTPAPAGSAPAATPTPSAAAASADPAGVARAVEGLLVRSDRARGTLNSATGPLGTCRIDPAGAASTIQSVVDERRRILADLQALSAAQVAALPSGDQLVSALGSAMQASIAADQAYVQWADDAQGCTPGQQPPAQALRQGNELSRSAQSAKSIFVTLWNPIAEKYGLPTRTANDV
ncbi:MAG: hypothetical protein ACTHQ3_02565 [Motilibacteraceae bacterium]